MIYIYRTLWLIFYIPIILIGIAISILGLPATVIVLAAYYIITGSTGGAPDVFIPFLNTISLWNWYENLQYKIENLNKKRNSYDY